MRQLFQRANTPRPLPLTRATNGPSQQEQRGTTYRGDDQRQCHATAPRPLFHTFRLKIHPVNQENCHQQLRAPTQARRQSQVYHPGRKRDQRQNCPRVHQRSTAATTIITVKARTRCKRQPEVPRELWSYVPQHQKRSTTRQRRVPPPTSGRGYQNAHRAITFNKAMRGQNCHRERQRDEPQSQAANRRCNVTATGQSVRNRQRQYRRLLNVNGHARKIPQLQYGNAQDNIGHAPPSKSTIKANRGQPWRRQHKAMPTQYKPITARGNSQPRY